MELLQCFFSRSVGIRIDFGRLDQDPRDGYADLDPDPVGQKGLKNVEKSEEISSLDGLDLLF